MNRVYVSFVATLMAYGCAKAPEPSAAPATAPALVSGIDVQYIDAAVRPQDDFYKHINGKWLAETEIPPDKGSYGAFAQLRDDSEAKLHAIIDDLQKSVDQNDPNQPKIADLYSSFMDEPTLEILGVKPLSGEFARIEGLKEKKDIAGLIAHFNQIGVTAPYSPFVHQDAKDSTRYVFDLEQDGLGMPDRDYYLLNDEKLKQARARYGQHVQKMLELAGDKRAAASAKDIVALETQLAKIQWTKVELRDPVKTYNKVQVSQLAGIAPGLDWSGYLADTGVQGKTDYLILGQPSYLRGLSELLQKTPLSIWQTYFRWRLLSDMSPYLSKPFVDEHFAFYGTALRGIPENRARWKRGIALIENSIGEGMGKLFTARYFPPESKARMEGLVRNLLAAYRADIETLDWMSGDTRQKALAKLAKFTPKIGYPDKWRDYAALRIDKGDLVGNVIRAQVFEFDRNLNKLGKPIDRGEWGMTPQTVNAYYNPEMNEIVFPAAILQPPFFDPRADDAAIYGGIGSIIGHEISHGFDDQGSQYDGDGNLLDSPGWFTQADLDKFKEKTRALVAQYSAYEPVPGFHVNGKLTLGENIADNAGLAISYKAYKLSLNGKDVAQIDGMTGDQRFFAGWAQAFRGKSRSENEIVLLKTDPHSPAAVRGTVPEMNQNAFFDAYAIKDGDKMYVVPEQRVTLW
jgi:predicted metalloendopeptidase